MSTTSGIRSSFFFSISFILLLSYGVRSEGQSNPCDNPNSPVVPAVPCSISNPDSVGAAQEGTAASAGPATVTAPAPAAPTSNVTHMNAYSNGTSSESCNYNCLTANPGIDPDDCEASCPSATGSTSSGSSSGSGSSGAANGTKAACTEAWTQTMQECQNGGQASQMAMMAQLMARNATAGSNSAYAACQAMQMQGLTAIGGAGGVYAACKAAVNSCDDTCNTPPTNGSQTDASYMQQKAKQCSSIMTQVYTQMGMAGMQTFASLMGASQCNQLVQAQQNGQCTGANAISYLCNPTAFCASNQTSPQCGGLMAACANTATAASNPMCAGLNGTPLSTALPTTNVAGLGDSQQSGYAGYQASAHQAGMGDSGSGGSGMGGMGGGGGYPGGAGGPPPGGGGAGSGLKADVGGGYGGGGGSGAVTMGNSTDNSGGKGGHGMGDLDLSRFLPNGDLAARGLASVGELTNKGITGANDLSNFEKVTRMMSQKRKILNP